MTLTNLFQIDGKSLYAPDCDIEPSYSDLDSSDSGRDEAGYMHREVVREKVSTWPIAYSCLTDDEYKYTIGLFAGKATFQFTHPKAVLPPRPKPPPATAANTASPGITPRRNSGRTLNLTLLNAD